MTVSTAEQPLLASAYDPKQVEARIYQFWLDGQFFQATGDPKKEPFTIVIPPPNVTGVLHIGHALDNSLQDVLARWKRMAGYDVLWLPGTDHAGIATQARVESTLRETEGVTRHDLGREAFVERIWQWKEQYGDRILSQLKTMGFSCDWSRVRFTFDEGLSGAVREVFVRLYEQGKIYRGYRIINWCPRCQTALSDEEVEHVETDGRLYHLRYPFAEGDGFLTVATTRPETMLGDVAVAVHPDDERYQSLIGKHLALPLTDRLIPVIADSYVDASFGTGCVKITPAHDPNDFEVGQRHHLPQILVMNGDGTMSDAAGAFVGMDRFAARKTVIEQLGDLGLLDHIDDHTHNVGHCSRCQTIVEPYLSAQWFVDMKEFAEIGLKAVSEGSVHFIPENFVRTYEHWLTQVRDWCISRQLWWGHRIPAWYCAACEGVTVARDTPNQCVHCGHDRLEQDPDVLDTWFSSALWPFSTMGWPDQTPDLARYYPTNVLVTGRDIIFFWVARMIMMGITFTGEAPFSDVLIHGLVRDREGRKMSKSLGNGVDPLDIVEQFGADATRFGLLTGFSQGQDQRFQEERIESARHFANKIWNAARFVLMNVGGRTIEDLRLPPNLGDAEKWILHRLGRTAKDVSARLEKYDIGDAGRIIYDFIWGEFCDWYIELAKNSLYGEDEQNRRQAQAVLVYVLDQSLRLLHPFMPFVTEEIWQHIPHVGSSICVAEWPGHLEKFENEAVAARVDLWMEAVRTIRNIRSEMSVAPSRSITVIAKPDDLATAEALCAGAPFMRRLINAGRFEVDEAAVPSAQDVVGVIRGAQLTLPLHDLIDVEAEVARLDRERKELDKEVERVVQKLANERFVSKAPQEVVEAERVKKVEYEQKREKVIERLQALRS